MIALIRKAIEMGVTFLDTSPISQVTAKNGICPLGSSYMTGLLFDIRMLGNTMMPVIEIIEGIVRYSFDCSKISLCYSFETIGVNSSIRPLLVRRHENFGVFQ